MIVQIVILAMIAAFLGLRLYSVLGRRAEHEEEIVPGRLERKPDAVDARDQPRELAQPSPFDRFDTADRFAPSVSRGIEAIAAADRNFNPIAFLEGAKNAYRMILEAFWRGDRETLEQLCDPDVYRSFLAAIEEREAAGYRLENRLIRIEESRIEAARLDGNTALISVLFVADIAALTRDANGEIVAGSLDDAVVARDLWTFARDVSSPNPDWLLVETDEG